jgi:hypothetical protein
VGRDPAVNDEALAGDMALSLSTPPDLDHVHADDD